jgi:hypothetical protein
MYLRGLRKPFCSCSLKSVILQISGLLTLAIYVLSHTGIEASDNKIKAVKQYPVSKSVKDVRALLGFCSFYRLLMPHFVDIAKPLTQVTKKDKFWHWTPECQNAFEELKHKLSSPPVLAFPDLNSPFILMADRLQVGLGAVSQVQNGIERPIAYTNRQPNKAEAHYSALEVEALAVFWVTKYFRCYLYCIKFLVRTHHAALSFLHRFMDNKSRLMRWSLSLSDFAFDIEHIPGTEMGHMNALS